MLSFPSFPYSGDKAKNEIGPLQVKKKKQTKKNEITLALFCRVAANWSHAAVEALHARQSQ